MYSRKVDSPNYIEFSKNLKRIGRFVWFQKSYKGKIYLEPCFQIIDLGQFEKSQQVYLSEKEGEAISAIRNSDIHDAENLELVPKYEAKSGKESTMDQELDICSRVYEIATYNMRRVCVTIKKYHVHKPPYIQIRLFTAKGMKQWNKLPMSTIRWTNSKNCPKFWESLCLLIIVNLSSALWFFASW